MNSEEAGLLWHRKNDIEHAGGDAAHRQHALKHLKLKTVIKESHCTPLQQLSFNYTDEHMHNLFATVGHDQVTIYDDLHMGDFVAVVVSFTNEKTEYTDGGGLQACTWMTAEKQKARPHGDAILAVAGSDHHISLISVVEAQVVGLLKGHTKDVLDLSACAGKPNLLVSLSKEGNVRVWDASQETCTASYCTEASCLAVSPDGQYFVTGGKKGSMHSYQIPAQQQLTSIKGNRNTQTSNEAASKERLEMECGSSGRHTETIDCMRFLCKDQLASKSVDGRMCVWSIPDKKLVSSWKVPSSSAGASLSARLQFGATPDGSYICVGNTTGDVYVYDTADGKRMTHVAPIKVSAPVKACGISPDCRHLLAAVGNGFLFRFEYRKPDAQESQKENVDANMLEDDG